MPRLEVQYLWAQEFAVCGLGLRLLLLLLKESLSVLHLLLLLKEVKARLHLAGTTHRMHVGAASLLPALHPNHRSNLLLLALRIVQKLCLPRHCLRLNIDALCFVAISS